MGSDEALKLRHTRATEKLKEVANRKLKSGSATQTAFVVGLKLGITGQTVLNYLNGNCRDGFLTEALTMEFRKLKN